MEKRNGRGGGVEECKRDVKKILEELGKKVKGVSKKILEEEWEREYGEEGKGGRRGHEWGV